ncbi:MAG: DUF6452 family protein [Flavobacterium haoranii]
MKKISILTLVIFTAFSLGNCEKDDICADGTITTPQLVIEFFDATDQTQLKNVTNLLVVAEGYTSGFAYSGVNQILFPLKTTDDVTTLQFIQNGTTTDTADDNIDSITFNYIRENIYISRACGYKTNFTLNDLNGVQIQTDSDNWISTTVLPIIEQPEITNENEVHVKIYF